MSNDEEVDEVFARLRQLTADIEADLKDKLTAERATHRTWQKAQTELDRLVAEVHDEMGWQFGRIAAVLDVSVKDVGKRISRHRRQ